MSRYNAYSILDATSLKDLGINPKIANKLPNAGRWNVYYGFDHACGYFIQFFVLDEVSVKECERLTFKDNDCVDFDTIFHGLTGIMLSKILEKCDCNPHHIDYCALDMSF